MIMDEKLLAYAARIEAAWDSWLGEHYLLDENTPVHTMPPDHALEIELAIRGLTDYIGLRRGVVNK